MVDQMFPPYSFDRALLGEQGQQSTAKEIFDNLQISWNVLKGTNDMQSGRGVAERGGGNNAENFSALF